MMLENILLNKVEFFDDCFRSDEELFAELDKNRHSGIGFYDFIVVFRYRFCDCENWDSAHAIFENGSWHWKEVQHWKRGKDFEYFAAIKQYHVEDFICGHVQCIVESLEDCD